MVKENFVILDFIEKDEKIDYDVQKNKKIIKGNKSLAHKIFSRENIDEEEEEFIVHKNELNMTNILNRDELADDYLTPKDMKIKKTDVPERILLKFNEKDLESIKQSINAEAEWIIEKIKSNLYTSENLPSVKKKIVFVLECYKSHFDDIPYIVTYKRNFYEPELTSKDVWKIFDYDREWNKLIEMKANLTRAFDTIKKFAIEDEERANTIYTRCIENAKSIVNLNDMELYIEFLKEMYFEDFQNLNEVTSKNLRPNKSSQIQNFRRNKIDDFARKFSFGAFELSCNLELLALGDPNSEMISPPDPLVQPEKLAYDYLCNIFDQEIKVMTAGCKFLALELFSFPFIRNYARNSFKSQCSISTEPTEEGKKELDAFNTSFRVKRLRNKPIDSFNNDLFLDIIEAEKKGLINVTVHFGDNFFKDLTDKLNHTYNSKSSNTEPDSVQHSWRVMREETLRIFVAEHCIPYFKKEVRLELQENAENYVINESAMNFSKLLLTGPYKKKKEGNNNVEDQLLKEEEYPKVLSLIYDNSKNEVYSVMLDSNGEVSECCKFTSIMNKPNKLLNKDDKDARMEDEAKCRQMIQDHKPDLIVIGANDLKCKYLKEHIVSLDPEIMKKNDDGRIWITFGDITIPRISANCPKVEKLLPSYNYFYRIAVCLGRFKQNPIAEISLLWHEDLNKNYCLSIPLHPLIRSVNQGKLCEALETEAVKIVNLIGLDINKTCEHSHLNAPLQFISGLGPRKAHYLIDRINRMGGIMMRNLLIAPPRILNEIVYINCVGFIRVRKNKETGYDFDPLDITRIHPENYPLANKIAKAAMDENFKDTSSEAIKIILKDPKKIQCLDLQEYIKKSAEKGNKNAKFNINFITSEFACPFKDERTTHKDLTPSELFYLLLGDPTFRKGQLVLATVLKVDNQHVKCRLHNDLEATVWVKDIFDDDKSDDIKVKEMQEKYKEGMVIDARVKSINEHTFKIDLTLKPSELISVKNYFDVERRDNSFVIVESEDLINRSFLKDTQKQAAKYQIRSIKHSNFKNINYIGSLNLLRNKEIGAHIYRPSSKGSNYLTLSWKFYDDVYSHIEIVEEDKPPGATISNRLRVGNEIYRSLTEITDRYLKPCEMLVKDVIDNRKFMKFESLEEFERKIKEDKSSNKSLIQYLYTILPEFPQYILMGYSAKVGSVTKEYIKVKPNGLYFHNEYFSNIEELSNWFKKNYGSDSYRDYVKRCKPPTVEENKKYNNDENLSLEFGSIQNDIYDSSRNLNTDQKSKDRSRSNKTCHNCNELGHFASECQNKNLNNNSYNREIRKDYFSDKNNRKFRDDREFTSHKRNRSPNNSDYSGVKSHRSEEKNSNWGNENINKIDDNFNSYSNSDWRGVNTNLELNQDVNRNRNNFKDKRDIHNVDFRNKGRDDEFNNNFKPNENIDLSINKDSNSTNVWGNSQNNNMPIDKIENEGWGSNKNENLQTWNSVSVPLENLPPEEGWSSNNFSKDKNNSNEWSSITKNDNFEDNDNFGNNRDRNFNFRGGNTRGRGGRGGRTGDKRGCYNCGEDGHISTNCPNPKKNEGNRSKTCFKCQKEGHISINCPNTSNRDNFKKPKPCYNCGEEGHMANDCPKKQRDNKYRNNDNKRDNYRPMHRNNNYSRDNYDNNSSISNKIDNVINNQDKSDKGWINSENFKEPEKIQNNNGNWDSFKNESINLGMQEDEGWSANVNNNPPKDDGW